MKTTLAMIVGAMFGDDGQCFRTASDRNLKEVAESRGASISYPNGRGTTPIVYVFVDGSAIVECDAAWDYRADGCTEHCWAGVGCDCAERAAEARRLEARETALDLCNGSNDRDEIVRAPWTQELDDELNAFCEGRTDTGDEVEFWGDLEDGGDFRVHLVKAGE